MPDKWEYSWYASWDLAFQAVVMAAIDPALIEKTRRNMPCGAHAVTMGSPPPITVVEA